MGTPSGIDYSKPRPTARDLVAAEVAKQDKMWGAANERADVSRGELLDAGIAYAILVSNRKIGFDPAEANKPSYFPQAWSGFRYYGSDIATLVVAGAFIEQEIKRRLNAGEDFTRSGRTQPYTGDVIPLVA